MTIEVTVGPRVLTINRGETFMVTDYNGEIHPELAEGVFFKDTRFVSGYRLWANGKAWHRLTSTTTSYHSARLYLVNPQVPSAGVDGLSTTIPYSAMGLALARSVEQGEIQEVFKLTSHVSHRVSIVLEIELTSDFADLFEVKAGQLRQCQHVVTEWHQAEGELVTTYRDRDFQRRLVYRVVLADEPPSYANGRLLFSVNLDPGESWRAACQMLLETGASLTPLSSTPSVEKGPGGEIALHPRGTRADELHERWLRLCTDLSTPNQDLNQSYRQSVDDMGALRLLERDLGPDVWVPAAGVPWYVTLFGRDSLIASLQNLPVYAPFAKGALRILAQYQAHERDDWRDAQPGKIMHEIRHGELAHFHLIPHTPYYGTWDATPLYLIALHEAWRWLGDRQLVESLLPVAEGCLEWIDRYGDLDGDGFQEYRTFSPKGYENMSWKDARDSVVYPDGTPVQQPKATCELQGYVYAAKRGMAEVFDALGKHDRAKALEAQAAELKRRFDEAFWMEDEGTYAFALDPKKRQVKTIVSNAGHCLWTGIADEGKAARVVGRLLAPDMWSGWGVRTLSARHLDAYNPHSYQRGSVWPHDNGIIAAGFKRYGFADQANQIAKGILDAAAIFQSHRLPEVFAGLGRDEAPFPVQYWKSNIPQAWAAGSIFHFVRTILGLRADVPDGKLWVNPTLPDWIPSLELCGLKVGPVSLRLRFWREGKESRFAVESEEGGHLEVLAEQAPIAAGTGK